MQNNKRILFISSANPTKGSGVIGMNMYHAFKEKKYEVDFLTLYKVPFRDDIKFIYKKPSRIKNFLQKIKKKFCKFPLANYYFFYKKEVQPPVKVSKILNVVGDNYDLVFIYFWQGLLSFQTIDKLYDKLKCSFVFLCADFSPMSGGCHFTGNCQRYKNGCGCCPAFKSDNPNDFTHWNVLYREKIYDKVKPVLLANTYMIEYFFKHSYLLKEQKCLVTNGTLNLDKFKPFDPTCLYKKFNISDEKRYVISFGSQSLTDERKGMVYLLEALDKVYELMTEQERSQTLIMFVGKNGEQIVPQIKFESRDLGFISSDELPAFYSVSTLFLCASVNDAGPSMLKQSVACGTPIVAFEMGSALDILKQGNNNGYCAKLRDSQDLATGILTIIRMLPSKYRIMRNDCRKWAIENCSLTSFMKLVENTF